MTSSCDRMKETAADAEKANNRSRWRRKAQDVAETDANYGTLAASHA